MHGMHAKLTLPLLLGKSDTRVELDGHDVSNAVRALSIQSEAGEVTILELELIAAETITIGGRVMVDLGIATTEFLVALGWTPPAEAE